MPNVQCVYAYTCMRFTLHSEIRAYPSYGHPPRQRCPDKGGLSVPTTKLFLKRDVTAEWKKKNKRTRIPCSHGPHTRKLQ